MENKKTIINITIMIIMLISLIIGFYFIGSNTKLGKTNKNHDFSAFVPIFNAKNIIENQKSINDDTLASIKNGVYTFDNPLITINPYGNSPLSAFIGFKTEGETEISIKLIPKEGGSVLTFNSSLKQDHLIPVYGLYQNYENKLEITDLTNEETLEISIITDEVHLGNIDLTNAQVNQNNFEDDDFYFLSSYENKFVAAYDKTGDLRWYFSPGVYNKVSKLPNGNYLMSYVDGGDNESFVLVEIDIIGKIHKVYELSHPYLNNYINLPNGNILYTSTNNKIIEFDLNTGKTIKILDLNKIISDIDSEELTKLNLLYENGNINNFINYLDYKDDEILITLYPYNTIINLKDYKLNWIISEDFSDKFSSYLINGDIDFTKTTSKAKFNNNNIIILSEDINENQNCSTNYNLISNEYTLTNKTLEHINNNNFTSNVLGINSGDYVLNKYALKSSLNKRLSDEVRNCLEQNPGSYKSSIDIYDQSMIKARLNFINSYDYFEKSSFKYEGNYQSKINYLVDNLNDYNYKEEDFNKQYETASDNGIYLELFDDILIAYFNADKYKIILMDEYGMGHIYEPINNSIRFKKLKTDALVLIEMEGEIYNTGYYIEKDNE